MFSLHNLITFVFILLTFVNCEHSDDYSDLEVRISQLEKNRAALSKAVKEQKAKNGQLLKDVTELKESLEHQNRKRATCSGVVAFHTRLTNTITFNASSQTIIYDNVQTNIGAGYNANTGQFTAPVTGNYQFIATAMSTSGNYADIEIVTTPGTYCRAHAGSQSQAMGTCVAFVSLNKGYIAYVRRYSSRGNNIVGGKYSSFSGHLIST